MFSALAAFAGVLIPLECFIMYHNVHPCLCVQKHDIPIDTLRCVVVTMIVSGVKVMFNWNVLCCSNYADTLIQLKCFIMYHHVHPCLCVLKHDILIDEMRNLVITMVVCGIKMMFFCMFTAVAALLACCYCLTVSSCSKTTVVYSS
jgi:hypothetical protein